MTKDVKSLIELLPDALPCHLAGLCRLNCRDVNFLPRGSPRPDVVKVFAFRSKIFPSVLVSGPIHLGIPSRDPDPPPKSWFSALFGRSSVVIAQAFSRGLQSPRSVAEIYSV